jgi:CubicO group peptidase (beta-lactamase class C family)
VGGVGGPVAAMALERAGIQATVYEAADAPADHVGLFLNTSSNGLDMLRTLGVDAAGQAEGFPMPPMVMWSGTGKRLGEVANGIRLADGTVSVALELWWEPGTKVGYHAYTFGYIVGEVVRRATGKPISQVLAEEVAGPLGVADELWFGMPASEHHRLARLEDEPAAAELAAQMMASMPPDLPMFRSAPPELFPNAEFGNRADTLAADIPAGGKTSARAIARMYAALLGEVDGVRLLTPERLAEATAVSSSGTDEVFGNPSTWGLGYGIGGPTGDAKAAPTVFGLGGVGGSFACGDTASGIAWAVTKNRISNDFSTSTQLGQLIAGAG